MKKQFKKVIGIKVALTIMLVCFCAGGWPGYLIHTYKAETRFTTAVLQSPVVGGGDVICQRFMPSDNWLSKIRFAIVFEGVVSEQDMIQVSIVDESDRIILEEEIQLNTIESGNFFYVSVDKQVNPSKVYEWSITMPTDSKMQYALLYTEDLNGNAVENQELSINSHVLSGSALNQYEYYAHFDKATIIGGFWAGAFVVYLILIELAERAEKYVRRKNDEDKMECVE